MFAASAASHSSLQLSCAVTAIAGAASLPVEETAHARAQLQELALWHQQLNQQQE
jgi:hypothetical protein